MRPDDITQYTYRADIYPPDKIAAALARDGYPVSPGELNNVEAAETMLDELAGLKGINRLDERSFDSDDFPKIVFADGSVPL